MTEERFWSIVDSAKNESGTNHRRRIESLQAQLGAESAEDLISFERWFGHAADEAYRWDLYAAAYLIHGGIGFDDFIDFRTWLISLGREAYAAVMQDTDALIPLMQDEPAFKLEAYAYVAEGCYEALTHVDEMPYPEEREWPASLKGAAVDVEDDRVLEAMFPALWAEHGWVR